VGFDIEPAAENGSSAWLATYSSQGKTARFRFELAAPDNSDDAAKGISVAFGKGKFVAIDGSDASALLGELKKALEAKNLPGKVQRVKELPFVYATFGDHQS